MRAQSTNNEKTGARSTPDAGADVTRNAKGRRVASVGILAGFAMLVRALIGWIIGLALTIMLVLAGLLVLWRYVPPVSTLMIARYVMGTAGADIAASGCCGHLIRGRTVLPP
jgi:hypothetical protein